jgi:cell wall-associated NlpC family hydrolase
MRRPHRRFKDRRPHADHLSMAPGGAARRRLPAFIAAATVLVLSVGWSSAQPAFAVSVGRTHAREGDADSGMPSTPIVYPDAARARLAAAPIRWSDLDEDDAWARTPIDYVAGINDWMRDYAAGPDGRYPFRPDAYESRKYLARAVVRAFAPAAAIDPGIVFTDLDAGSPFYRYANVAVARGWLGVGPDGSFLPDGKVSMVTLHRVLVYAVGLKRAAHELDRLHTRNGVRFDTPPGFGTTVLGMRLSLRYNHSDESRDVGPADLMTRADVAYSLFRATTQPDWNLQDLTQQYSDLELPWLGPKQQAIVRWGVRYAGYPYVWGGEWGFRRAEPAALGGQPVAGFDCSGLTWWLLRHNDGGAWKIAPPRPYGGWSLPQRVSRDMANATTDRLRFRQLRPGDAAFYDGDGDGIVDHVDTYIGNGFALDSSSTPGGVTIMWVGTGWYRDHFVWGRRLLPG